MLSIQSELRSLANPEKAKVLSGFFKTEKGQYGDGDTFLGIQVPDTRKVVKQYLSEMNLDKVEILLKSKYHEERLAGVHTLVEFSKKKLYSIKELGDFYMNHRDRINNWDLVDTSAPQIIGPYIESFVSETERANFIESCIMSNHLWTNRIIILASFYHINQLRDEGLTFYIVKEILQRTPVSSLRGTKQSRKIKTLDSGINQEGQNDIHFNSLNHDLMHKACGWMLREVGKRVNEEKLCEFLDEYASEMPRTMLRYAIERLNPEIRKEYLRR